MTSYTAVVKPEHWDAQHYQLYNRLRNKHALDLLEELKRYLDAKNDPKLSQLPPDMIGKTIEVFKFILEEERDNDVDLATDIAKVLGAIP